MNPTPNEPFPTYVGTAAWNIPAAVRDRFPGEDSILERYARVLNGVEINSSFYKDHQAKTYARWAEAVPESFRFAVKLSRFFTHETHLKEINGPLHDNLAAIAELGSKWGVLLVQLPPQLGFDVDEVSRFFSSLRERYEGPLVLEPRHPRWVTDDAIEVMSAFEISKAIVDPEVCPSSYSASPKNGVTYVRLHGSPVLFESRYPIETIDAVAGMIGAPNKPQPAWCIFDNTKYGYATDNALELTTKLQPE